MWQQFHVLNIYKKYMYTDIQKNLDMCTFIHTMEVLALYNSYVYKSGLLFNIAC